MQSGSPLVASIVAAFGESILQRDGSINRAQLAHIVFGQEDELRKLEAIVHPAVRTAIRTRVRDLAGRGGAVVIDAIKLLQSDLLELADEVWVVLCPPAEQMRRLVDIRGMSADQASARIRAQPSFEHPRVARIIANDGTEQELEERVARAWQEFSAGSI